MSVATLTSKGTQGLLPEPQALAADPACVHTVLDLIFGRWRSQIAYAGVCTGVLEILAEADHGAGDIAERSGLVPDRLYRLLRALATLGLVRQTDEDTFTLSREGRLLTTGGVPSLRAMLLLEEGPQHYAAWRHLPTLLRESGASGFEREFGGDAWHHLNVNPAYKTVFQDAMSAYSASEAQAIVASVTANDLTDTGTLCDVGGGDGLLLLAFARAFPDLSHLLFDLPAVIDTAAERNRCEGDPALRRVGGDMFETVPPADVYLLKHVLHDWNDEECAAILRNLRTHAQPGARLLICEFVIPNEPVASFAALFDVHMMCVSTGRQRTARELGDLLNRTGWEAGELRSAGGSPISVLFARAIETGGAARQSKAMSCERKEPPRSRHGWRCSFGLRR